jgi:poly(hydroxyalkanoate) granule-associated protein
MATEDENTQQAGSPPARGEPSPDHDSNAAVVQCANLFLVVRRLLFTSLGALALTADEARQFVDRLVERGAIGEGELQDWMDDLHQTYAVQKPATGDFYRNGAEGRIEAIWGRLRVPTRREIDDLSRKIGALDARLTALRRQREQPPPPTDAGAPPPDG